MIKLMNSGTHSCTHSLVFFVTCETFAICAAENGVESTWGDVGMENSALGAGVGHASREGGKGGRVGRTYRQIAVLLTALADFLFGDGHWFWGFR